MTRDTALQRAVRRQAALETLAVAMADTFDVYRAKPTLLDLVGVLRDAAVLVERMRQMAIDFPELATSPSLRAYAQRVVDATDEMRDVAEQYVAGVQALESLFGPVREALGILKEQRRTIEATAAADADCALIRANYDKVIALAVSVPGIEGMIGAPYAKVPIVIEAHRRIFTAFLDALGGPSAAALPAA